jgi:hypothetical protein
MINPAPLFIVMGTILALLAVQRVLSRTVPPEQQNKPPQPAPIPPRPRGRPITAGLSVTGLDDRGIGQLKQLITQGDVAALTTFLAFNRPGFIEIDQYLQQLKAQQATQSTQNMQTTAQDTIPAPAGLQFASLSKDVRQKLLSFEPKSPRLITRELMSRFGSQDFSSNFAHYAAREKSVTLHFPPFDPDRRVMEALVKSGIARKGRHIPLAQRLTVLKMSQLRQMAKDLNLDKKFTQKQKAAAMLAEVPGAAVLLSMQYVVDDLFMLNPIGEDCEQVKDEWDYLTAYAKLLGTLKLTQ